MRPDSAPLSRAAAVATVVGFAIAVLSGTAIAWSAGGSTWDEVAQGIPMTVPFGAFGLVGALILWRRPGHLVGWVCAGLAGFMAVAIVAMAYGGWGLASATPPPGTVLAIWIANWSWYPIMGLATIALPLLIPDGRLVSVRWRWVALTGSLSVVGLMLLAMLHVELFAFAGQTTMPNPIGVAGVPSPAGSTVATLLLLTFSVTGLGALASMVVRYRRSQGEDRTRLKWVVFGFVLTLSAMAVLDVVQTRLLAAGGAGISNTVWAAVWTLLPASIGIAVLRHRLFDIDRIVSRTVSYALVTVVLVGVYAGGVVGLGAVLRVVTGGPGGELVVAASTLLVAAAFGPVRRRAQAAVDRRFNRASYDAQRTVEAFAQRLRDEVDLDALVDETRGIALETVQPAHASLWLRSPQVVS